METTGFDLAGTIDAVARIDANGQLSELLQQYSLDCRGLPADRAALHTANELVHVQAVAKAIAAMFGLPVEDCLAATRSVLLPHRRRAVALDLIDYYCGRQSTATSPSRSPEAGRPQVGGKLTLPLVVDALINTNSTGAKT